MKNFYIIVNEEKENTRKVRQDIEAYVRERGGSCRFSKGVYKRGSRYTSKADILPDTDCVITLGGDGTLIQAARELAGVEIPIVGINLGGLGYLTQMGRDGDVRGLLDALLEDRYEIEDRMMLEGRAWHDGKLIAEHIALNDVVMTREGELRVLRFKIYVNDRFLYEYSADGMIVATPTGSTAYNLSAGGPVAQPEGQMLLLTPICAHTLTARTIVLGANSRIKIEVSMKNDGNQMAVFDGDTRVILGQGDYIEIVRSEMTTRVIKLDDRSFLDILKRKMYNA